MADGSWSYPPSLFPDILRCFLIAAAEGPRGVNYGDSCLAGTPEGITELEAVGWVKRVELNISNYFDGCQVPLSLPQLMAPELK